MMYKETRQQRNWLGYFFLAPILVLALLALTEPLLAQDSNPCKAKEEFEEAEKKAKEAEQDLNKLTKPTTPKPTEDKTKLETDVNKLKSDLKNLKTGSPVKKKDWEDKIQNERTAADERIKKLKELEGKKTQIKALNELIGPKEKEGTIEAKISKAKGALDSLNQKVEVTQLKGSISTQKKKIKDQTGVSSIDEAKKKVKDTSYKNYDPSKANKADEVLKAGEDLLKFTTFSNDKIKSLLEGWKRSSFDPRSDVMGLKAAVNEANRRKGGGVQGGWTSGENPWDEIRRIGPELIEAIESHLDSVEKDMKTLKAEEESLSELEKKLIPDEGTRDLIDELPSLHQQLAQKNAEKAKLESEKTDLEKTKIPELDKKVEEAQAELAEARSIYIRTTNEIPQAEKEIKQAETTLKEIEAWDKWEDADKKKTEADKKVTEKKTAYDAAEKEQKKALTKAKDAPGKVDDYLNKQMDELIKGDPGTRNKAEAEKQSLNGEIQNLKNQEKYTKVQKARIFKKWEEVKKKIIKEANADIRSKYNERRQKAIQALNKVRARLKNFECFDDVKTFIGELDQKISGLQGLTGEGTSLVSDINSPNPRLKLNYDFGSLIDVPTDDQGSGNDDQGSGNNVVVNANFNETVTNQEDVFFSTTANLTANFTTGSLTGSVDGSNRKEGPFGCADENNPGVILEYATFERTINYSAVVSGQIDPATGAFNAIIKPSFKATDRYIKPFTNPRCIGYNTSDVVELPIIDSGSSGTISGTISPNGAVNFTTSWDAQEMHVSGSWSGTGAVQQP